ncbi:hypothetical protein [Allorhodopirellula solitaria]|uniref:hypothetical protein n=1 Tax=Allorhodopirellula solitaria TaxID=2527987 RepID=UPI0011B628E5|nr:hypothetical protein [Allorhodopirellula solitaria]
MSLYFVGMKDLNQHYRRLLALSDEWKVVDVDLDLNANRVIVALEHSGGKLLSAETDPRKIPHPE